MPDPIYYEMLEIPTTATPEEVREAYRLLAMVWHPDRFPKDSKLWTHANERMQQINEAYNALKNVQASDPRPATEDAPTSTTRPPTGSGPGKSEPSNPNWGQHRDQDLQREAATQRAQEQQRRIEEQKLRENQQRKQEAEQRRREEEERQGVISEQRRSEADRLRVLMRGKQRVEDVQHERAAKGLCPLCGKSLSAMDKLKRRTKHRDCDAFVDDPSAGASDMQA